LSRFVNYDLPWNPMKIGSGSAALTVWSNPPVLAINMALGGSVELWVRASSKKSWLGFSMSLVRTR
jgi:hypothetical protein